MPKRILTILMIVCLPLFISNAANADWLDKLKDTATELTDKAAEALKDAEPESPTTSDGEGQTNKPATTTAPAAPKAPATSTVTAPSAPKTAAPATTTTTVAPSGNNDTALVKATQTELKRLGYKIGVDGAYGPNTRKQIIAFEQSQSLEPTGDASVKLLAKLKETPTPAATTATTAASAPKAAESKAEETKAEPAKAPEPKAETTAASAVTPPGNKVLQAIVVKDEKYKGGRIYVDYPRDAKGWKATLSIVWYIRQNGKHAEVAPAEMRGTFKANIKTANTSYAIEGDCDITCPFAIPEEQRPQVYDEFSKLIETGGMFEFNVVMRQPNSQDVVSETFKVNVPSLIETADAAKAEQAKADEVAAAKQAEADKLAAAQKAKEEKKSAYTSTLSLEGKMIYEKCEQDHLSYTFYSCQCLAENMDTFVDEVVAKRLKDGEKTENMWLDYIQKSKSNPKYTDEQKEQTVAHGMNKLEQAKQLSATLKNRSGWDKSTRQSIVYSASVVLYKDPICKVGEGMRKDAYEKCMKPSLSKNVKGKTQEDYCSCVGNKAAELWTTSNQSYGSNVAVGVPSHAMTLCKN